jgi:hypothetical protein
VPDHIELTPEEPGQLDLGCSIAFTATIFDANDQVVDTDANVTFVDEEGGGSVTFENDGIAAAVDGVATMSVTGVENGNVRLIAGAFETSSNEVAFQVTENDCEEFGTAAPSGTGDATPPPWALAVLVGAGLAAIALEGLGRRTRPAVG